MVEYSGAEVIAICLKNIGIKHIFGIVGIPIIEVAEACIKHGIRMITFRNEQSAVYAASIYGYLTGIPGVCLVVGGPGVVHALAGVENANTNRFPLLLLAGSSETSLRGMGAFQQLDQISLVKAAGAKFAEQPASLESIPRLLEQAYKVSLYGKPGTAYFDLPANLIQTTTQAGNWDTALRRMEKPHPPPRFMGDPQRISAAALTLKAAKFPLLIVGKGCAYSRAEIEVRGLQSKTNISFIPTPMGKGVIPDSNSQNLSSARSAALKNADVILVFGARLNWILHYGLSPKFREDVRIIQVDSLGEELHGSSFGRKYLGIQGDIKFVASQLNDELSGWSVPQIPSVVLDKRKSNEVKAKTQEIQKQDTPLKYHSVYKVIRDTMEHYSTQKIVYVSEGANTMDISRSSFPILEPRTRLDAGTNATMGVGMGYAICAKVAEPDSLVVAIEGDSAFGFSAMEVETAVRSKLPMVIFVMNNSGVYHGADPLLYTDNDSQNDHQQLPSTALSLHTEYHTLARSLGAQGFCASTLDEVRTCTIEALKTQCVTVINVLIDSDKDKVLKFGWMAEAKL